MKNSSCDKYQLVVLVTCLLFLYCADGATTTVSCNPNKGCLNKQFEITCEITGPIQTGISWVRPDGLEVVTCNLEKCVSQLPTAYTLKKEEPTVHILQIEKFGNESLGTWVCRDGASGMMTQECNIHRILEPPEFRELAADCNFHSDNKELLNVACRGIISLGNPPVVVKMEFPVGNVTLNHPEYSESTNIQFGGMEGRCLLEGPAAECVEHPVASEACPQVGSEQTCVHDVNCMGSNIDCDEGTCQCDPVYSAEHGSSCKFRSGLIAGSVVGIIAGVLVVVVVAVIFYRKRHAVEQVEKGYCREMARSALILTGWDVQEARNLLVKIPERRDESYLLVKDSAVVKGYAREIARSALILTGWDVQEAVNLLLKIPERHDESHPLVKDSAVEQVVEKGYSKEMARSALILTGWDVQEALNLLVKIPERRDESNPLVEDSAVEQVVEKGFSRKMARIALIVRGWDVQGALLKIPKRHAGSDLLVKDSSVEQVVEKGYSKEMARSALILTGVDVQEALNLLRKIPKRRSRHHWMFSSRRPLLSRESPRDTKGVPV